MKVKSTVEPLSDNAYLNGDPLQYAQAKANAEKIDTGWYNAKLANGTPDFATMKKAIANAFRVVILSPRKELYWNAVQYQDMMDIPAECDDFNVYFHHMNEKRNQWNASKGRLPNAHVPYHKLLLKLAGRIMVQNPEMTKKQALDAAWKEVNSMRLDIEKTIFADKANDKLEGPKLEGVINKKIKERLEMLLEPIKEEAPKNYEPMMLFGAKAVTNPNQMGIGENEGGPQTYGGFFLSQLEQCAQIGKYLDTLLAAALTDVKEHDGTGTHFRQAVLDLGIKGIGPKVASFAWLLLCPKTSELATLDVHMAEILGADMNKLSDPDYYKRYEDQFRDRMAAAGYGHMPLGQAQWAMWDYKRTGPESHQDHSAMKVLNPVPYGDVHWAPKPPDQGEFDPDWWRATEGAINAT